MHRLLFLGLLLVVTGTSESAFCQQDPGTAPGSATSDAPGSQLQEVVVTAEKRAVNMQAVPISVGSLAGDTLEKIGITDSTQLSGLVPGLVITGFSGVTFPYIRGIGQGQAVNGVESPVATYIDGVYLLSGEAANFSLNNIDRVEVLRGPQGTLFGRNAVGGAINVITKDPSFQPSIDADVGYGNYDTVESHVYLTGGVSDTLAGNFAAYYKDRADGYGRNIFLGTETFKERDVALQNKWLWTPTDATHVTTNLLYDQGDFYGNPSIPPGFLAEDGVTHFVGEYNSQGAVDTRSSDDQYLGSIKVEQDLGWGRLVNLAAYHHFNNDLFTDLNAIPGVHINPYTGVLRPAQIVPIYNSGSTVTDEFQIQSLPAADFQWIAGLFYLHDRSIANQAVNLNQAFSFRAVGIVTTDSYAAFAQATKTIVEKTRLTLGARATVDEIGFGGYSTRAPINTTAGNIPASIRSSKPTFRASVDHDFMRNFMGYASVNTGYHAGRYIINNFGNPPARPETIISYEAGFKSEFLDHTLRFNVSGFQYDYSNVQVRGTINQGLSLVLNAAKARGRGVDVDAEAVPVRNLTISASAEYLDAKFVSFPNAPCPAPLFSGGVNTASSCNAAGNTFPNSPEFSGSLRVSYVVPTKVGDVTFSAGDVHSSGYPFEPDNVLRQSAYDNVNAAIEWLDVTKRFKVQLWATNLTQATIWADGTTGNSRLYEPSLPRMYGVTFGLHL